MEHFAEHLQGLRNVDEPERQEGIKCLQEICSDILNDPSNPKFRDLNHADIGKKLGGCQHALLLLFDVGFTLSEDEQRLQLKADDFSIDNIRHLQDALEAENAGSTVQLNTICYCHQSLKEFISSQLSNFKCRLCWEPLSKSCFICWDGSCVFRRISGMQFLICPSCYQQDEHITFKDTDEGRKQVFVSKLKSHINMISFVSVNIYGES